MTDVVVVGAARQVRPAPTEKPAPGTYLSMIRVGLSMIRVGVKATFQSYPGELDPDDPDLVAIEGWTERITGDVVIATI